MPELKTLRDLDAFMASPGVGCVTLNVAANGKVYGTVHFAQPDMSFKPENQWGDSTEEVLRAIMERRASVAVEAPLSAQRKSAMEDLL